MRAAVAALLAAVVFGGACGSSSNAEVKPDGAAGNPGAGGMPGVGGAGGGAECAPRATYAEASHLTINVTWPAGVASMAGTGQVHVWGKVVFTVDGNTLTGTLQACGLALPPTSLTALGGGGQVQIEVPSSAWDAPSAPHFQVAGTQTGWNVGSTLGYSYAALVGFTMPDGATASWPASYTGITMTNDADGDTNVGLTAVPRSGTGYTLPPTSIVQTSRADELYIVVRQVTSAMLTRTACDGPRAARRSCTSTTTSSVATSAGATTAWRPRSTSSIRTARSTRSRARPPRPRSFRRPPPAPTCAPPCRGSMAAVPPRRPGQIVAKLVAAALAAWALAAPPRAFAAGFAAAEFGGEHGNVVTTDPTALYFNPAGIALGEGTRLYVSGVLALRSATWSHAQAASEMPDPAGAEGADTGRAHFSNLLGAPALAATTGSAGSRWGALSTSRSAGGSTGIRTRASRTTPPFRSPPTACSAGTLSRRGDVALLHLGSRAPSRPRRARRDG